MFAMAHELPSGDQPEGMPVWKWQRSNGTAGARPCILLLHGWGGEAGLMGAFVPALLDLGYNVVIPDLPGQGKHPDRLVDTRTSAAAIVALDQKHGPFRAIIGHSLGGLLGCLVAAGHSKIGGKADPSKLVTINSPVSLGAVINGLGRAVGLTQTVIDAVRVRAEKDLGWPVADIHAQHLLREADLPLLAFHDTDDPFIPQTISLAQVAEHPKMERVSTSGLGHISVLDDPAVISRITSFLGPAS